MSAARLNSRPMSSFSKLRRSSNSLGMVRFSPMVSYGLLRPCSQGEDPSKDAPGLKVFSGALTRISLLSILATDSA